MQLLKKTHRARVYHTEHLGTMYCRRRQPSPWSTTTQRGLCEVDALTRGGSNSPPQAHAHAHTHARTRDAGAELSLGGEGEQSL